MKPFALSIPPLLVCLAGLASLPAQPPAPAAGKKDRDPAVEKDLKELNDAVMDRKTARDDAAGAIIDKLLAKVKAAPPDDMAPKDKDAFLVVLRDIYTKTKPREPEKRLIYEQAAFACEYLGASGAKVLKDAYAEDRFSKRDWLEQRASFLRHIGKTKDEKMIEFLTEIAVRSTDDPLLKAAGEALGNYEGIPLAKRKPIVKEMIKKLNEVHNSADKSVDPGDMQAKASRDTRSAILNPWNETLGKLTHQQIQTAPEWNHWYNKNKEGDWDKQPAKK
jgi:hypothetical protein